MSKKSIFRVIFVNQNKVYEIYASQVTHGGMLGFLEVTGLLFGERSALLLDPSEERLKTEFADVSRFYLPMHAVIRIDEMDKQGAAKISEFAGGNVTPFPLYTPNK